MYLLEDIDFAGHTARSHPIRLKSEIRPLTTSGRIRKNALYQNFPNPFNPETWIPYALATDANVNITIYNASGQQVRRLALGTQPAGSYLTKERAAYWDGRSDSGEPVSSGAYFYRFRAGGYSATRKMIIRK